MKRTTWRRIQVTAVREKSAEPYEVPRQLKDGPGAASLIRSFIGADPRELLVAIYLDPRHVPFGIHTVSIGTADGAPVHPREVFSPAVALGAVAVIVAHNHPSGDPTPSVEDRRITKRLREAGDLLGIKLLDHIVIGDGKNYSFSQGGFFQ